MNLARWNLIRSENRIWFAADQIPNDIGNSSEEFGSLRIKFQMILEFQSLSIFGRTKFQNTVEHRSSIKNEFFPLRIKFLMLLEFRSLLIFGRIKF